MLTATDFAALSLKVDANQAFMHSAPNPRDPATHPLPFPEVGNAETGLVEQYRLTTDKPSVFGAYLSCDGRNVTTWNGDVIGRVTSQNSWRNNFGAHCEAGRMRMADGTEYSWRGPGGGMYCTCRKLKAR